MKRDLTELQTSTAIGQHLQPFLSFRFYITRQRNNNFVNDRVVPNDRRELDLNVFVSNRICLSLQLKYMYIRYNNFCGFLGHDQS